MEGQFSLGSADNKGILSLLSAIEQTGDNFDTDPESPEPKDGMGGQEAAFNHLEGLEIHSDIGFSMSKAVCLCLICGQTSFNEPNDAMSMVDIFMEVSGRKLSQRIEDIVSRKILPAKHSTLICNECYGLLQQIEQLEVELLQYKRTVTSKFATSNPVKPKKASPKKTSFISNHASSIPSVSEPLDYSEPVIDPKMPLQFLANEKEIERDLEQMQERSLNKKSKLEILAETMRVFDDDYNYNSSDDENTFQDTLNNTKEKPVLECDVCNRVFKNNTLYQRHVKTHTKEKPYKCDECGKVFTSKSNMQAHQKTHFESKTYCCPHCSREFKGKKSLLEHVSSKHNHEKRFVCCQCPESFVSRHLKNVHERTHNGEKGFICDQCGDSFATSQGLSHHKSKHTGDYQFRCRACDKGFNNYKLLEEHFHIHTGNKPYQCSKCEKGFANRGSLWIHMKQHDNVKPYACTDCSKAFTHSSHLAVHKRIHTGEKPYKCRICGDGFISSNHLKRHMKSHANQLPFACGTCKLTFSQRRQLVTHSNKVHGGNIVEDTVQLNPTIEEESEENIGNSSSTFLINKVNEENLAEGEGYNLMPVVSIIEGDGMGGILGGDQMEMEGGMGQQRLVDLLGHDGVSLGQTIVLIQVPRDQNEGMGEEESMKVEGTS